MKNIRRDILIGVDDNIYDRGMEALNETGMKKYTRSFCKTYGKRDILML